LAQEALDTDDGAQLRVEHLQGDASTVFEVEREKHNGHPAAANLSFDLIAAGECRREDNSLVHPSMPIPVGGRLVWPRAKMPCVMERGNVQTLCVDRVRLLPAYKV